MKTFHVLLLLFLTGFFAPLFAPLWADQNTDKFDILSLDVKNHSIDELSASVLDSLTLVAIVIHAHMNQQQREMIIKGIE